MTIQEAVEFITGTNGKIFSVEFIKRSTGELRLMLCRTGVKSHLKGGELKYDAVEKGLVTVFDMSKNAYRAINISGIQRIKVAGEWEAVVG